jgi:hypothetical protein
VPLYWLLFVITQKICTCRLPMICDPEVEDRDLVFDDYECEAED